MFDDSKIRQPSRLSAILEDTAKMGFDMPSDIKTGSLLRFLSTGITDGRILELGTGTGISACWLLDGMKDGTSLTSVDNDVTVQQIAKKHLDEDPRVTFVLEDGIVELNKIEDCSVDLIFADSWPGKFEQIDLALSKLKLHGLYLIDDLLPQSNWPERHQVNVDKLVECLDSRSFLEILKLGWSSGLFLARRIS